MAFEKGKPRPATSGRKKGSFNKRPNLEYLIQLCNSKGVNPFEVMLDLCLDNNKHLRLAAAKEVAKYLLPQQKAIELTGDITMKPSILVKTDGTQIHFTQKAKDD